MPVKVKYSGGPRHGNKNILQRYDEAPATIAVPATEAKAANMSPGRYVLVHEVSAKESDQHRYQWKEGL